MTRDDVIKGLECLMTNTVPCEGCSYNGTDSCLHSVSNDALALLKEQDSEIKSLKSDLAETLSELAEARKEQEPKSGHWTVLDSCSNAGVYCSECQTKVFDHYPMKKKLSRFCPHCGAKMEDCE